MSAPESWRAFVQARRLDTSKKYRFIPDCSGPGKSLPLAAPQQSYNLVRPEAGCCRRPSEEVFPNNRGSSASSLSDSRGFKWMEFWAVLRELRCFAGHRVAALESVNTTWLP